MVYSLYHFLVWVVCHYYHGTVAIFVRARVLKNMSPAHPIFNTAMQKFPV